MKNYNTFVGLDVHKKNITVAIKAKGNERFIDFTVPHNQKGLKSLVKRVQRESQGEMISCYEAGICGFALQRTLLKLGLECQVIAPSAIPYKAGDRVKTDKRDARKLATYLESGLLTEVHPPSEEEEAVRDLCRARGAAVRDRQRFRQQILNLLLRHGFQWPRSNWTIAHMQWLRQLKFSQEAFQLAFEHYLLGLEQTEGRLLSMEKEIERFSLQEPYKEPVSWLRGMRGIDTITAMGLVCELYDFRRFQSPRKLMAYLGLVPSEETSADKVRRGPITKTGNREVRRLLVEAAKHCKHRPAVGKALKRRREGLPPKVIAIADKAMRRLYQRHCHLSIARNKAANKVSIALARELAGFVWAILHPYYNEKANS